MLLNQYISDNRYKHKKSDSLYAHYSMVDDYNVDIFPKLQLAHPFYYTLKEGESLYIPKKWWHWIKTTQKTFAVNYWFINEYEKEHAPFVFKHSIKYNTECLNDEEVHVWKSAKNYEGYRQCIKSFKDFYNSGKDNECVITLSNYKLGENNANIKNKLSNNVIFPLNDKLITKQPFDFNLWFCSNRHDTGLHYDDEDGILTIVEGEKDIILFPPSDSQYLYPYDVSFEWAQTPATKFRYNSFRKRSEHVKGICSGNLLYETCNKDARVLSNISKIYYRYPSTNLVWGFKKSGDEYRWEIYYYTIHDDIIITSWDILQNQYDIPNVEHYYYKDTDSPLSLPLWGYGKCKKDEVIHDESKIFVIDTYESFLENYNDYMDRLEYKSISSNFKEIILDTYRCYEICVHNKTPGQIFVQYLGISNIDFLFFLTEQQYPVHIVNFVRDKIVSGNYRINNEITIVYDIKTKKIVRSGFYGNL